MLDGYQGLARGAADLASPQEASHTPQQHLAGAAVGSVWNTLLSSSASPCSTRSRDGESMWGAKEDDGFLRFSVSRDGGAATRERVTEQHRGGRFRLALLSPGTASLPELLLTLLWPCPGSSLLMFNSLDGDSLSQAAHRRWCQRVGTTAGHTPGHLPSLVGPASPGAISSTQPHTAPILP